MYEYWVYGGRAHTQHMRFLHFAVGLWLLFYCLSVPFALFLLLLRNKLNQICVVQRVNRAAMAATQPQHTRTQPNESIKSTTAPLHSHNNYHSQHQLQLIWSRVVCLAIMWNTLNTLAGDVIACDTFSGKKGLLLHVDRSSTCDPQVKWTTGLCVRARARAHSFALNWNFMQIAHTKLSHSVVAV